MRHIGGVTIQSVFRALEILECFQGSVGELGISEIAEQMNLSKSTVFGLVNTLHMKGYLEQNEMTKRYRLGIKLFELGSLFNSRMDLRDEAKPYCEELSKKYNATVHLAVHYGNEILYVDKFDMPNALIGFSQVGKRAPLYCTGVGKAILSFLDDKEIDDYLKEVAFYKYTENTIADSETLMNELKQIKLDGFATDNEEIVPGLRCVSAPIFNRKEIPIAAISLSRTGNFEDLTNQENIIADVKNSAYQVSKRLGYNKMNSLCNA